MQGYLFVLAVLYVSVLSAQAPKSDYERQIDSLYQINLRLEAEYAEKLKTDSTAVRPEPAVWFMDMDGNIYNYPPDKENDSIMREREMWEKKLDSNRMGYLREESKKDAAYFKKYIPLEPPLKPIDPATLKLDNEWRDIIDSADLYYIAFARELMVETNRNLGSLLRFAGEAEGTPYTDSLGNLPPKGYNATMADSITRLIRNITLPVEPAELLKYKRVKSIQCNSFGWGFNEYSYFPCKIYYKNGGLFFEKTGGSQRKSGYLYRRDAYSYVFLGGWSVNDDPQTTYNSSHGIAGILYKVAPATLYMIFPGDNEYEIFCLKR